MNCREILNLMNCDIILGFCSFIAYIISFNDVRCTSILYPCTIITFLYLKYYNYKVFNVKTRNLYVFVINILN